jgi:hypothetical protein
MHLQTLKAKEGNGFGDKPRGDKSPSSSSSSAAAAATSSSAQSSAPPQSLPKENISFGNVAVGGVGLNDSKHKVKKVKADRRLLDKLNAKEEKLKQVEGTEEGERLRGKDKWRDAFAVVDGIKVKNDPKLVAKTIKRKEKAKESSRKKWDKRIKDQTKQLQERESKKAANISKRNSRCVVVVVVVVIVVVVVVVMVMMVVVMWWWW